MILLAVATNVQNTLLALVADAAAGSKDARGEAIVALSTMIGAMMLARIVPDPDLSAEILERAKGYLRR